MSLGTSSRKSQQKTTFGVRSTPFSTFDPAVERQEPYTDPVTGETKFRMVTGGGGLNLDPSIRGIQDRTLAGIQGSREAFGVGANQVLQNFGQTREGLVGNQGLFQRARVDPLRRQLATGRGELQRDLGRRKLSGSLFAVQAVQGFDIDAQRAIGNASALADAESLQAITGIDRDTLNALIGKVTIESQMRGEDLQIARDRLNQELQAFNLGKGGEGFEKKSSFKIGISGGGDGGGIS